MSINNKKWINDSFEEEINQIGGKEETIKKKSKLTEEEILAKKEEAHECRVDLWWWADKTIQAFLEEYVKEGENCYLQLNWRKIYSIDLINISQERWCDLEDAFYLLFFWKTKIEQQKEREEYNKQRELEKKRKELEIIEKIPWWIEEGKKYVDESKWSDWKEFVEYAAKGNYYHWEEVELVLKILEMIDNWDNRQKIQKVLDDEWGVGYYYSVVRNRVIYYSKKWIAARDNLHKPH